MLAILANLLLSSSLTLCLEFSQTVLPRESGYKTRDIGLKKFNDIKYFLTDTDDVKTPDKAEFSVGKIMLVEHLIRARRHEEVSLEIFLEN